MTYIPHTDLERQQMLAAIGVPTIEDLFEAVPSKFRFPYLDLPAPLSEMEVIANCARSAKPTITRRISPSFAARARISITPPPPSITSFCAASS